MLILEDTRQQAGKHKNINTYLTKAGIAWTRQALYVGDYIIASDGSRAVDTKQDVIELAGNILSQDHDRFAAECRRASEAGIQLLVLVEEALPEGGLSAWQSPTDSAGHPLTRVNPESLRRAMLTMRMKYGVRFRFCDARSTGRLLVEYLAEGIIPGGRRAP